MASPLRRRRKCPAPSFLVGRLAIQFVTCHEVQPVDASRTVNAGDIADPARLAGGISSLIQLFLAPPAVVVTPQEALSFGFLSRVFIPHLHVLACVHVEWATEVENCYEGPAAAGKKQNLMAIWVAQPHPRSGG